MSFYHKYRPKALDEVVGNEAIISSLSSYEETGIYPHAILLSGPTGCGKTTIARILANNLEARGDDLREVDAADFRGIDTIREIIDRSRYMPLSGNARVWIFDECHQLSRDAQSAMLKLLEDPADHAYFILCTTDPQKLLPTIKGRCQQFTLELLERKPMLKLLKYIAKRENIKLDLSIYKRIIKIGKGHPRNTIQLLEQIAGMEPKERDTFLERDAEIETQAIELCRALIKPNVKWYTVAPILRGLKNEDPEQIRRAILGYCSAILLSGRDNDAVLLVMEQMMDNFYDTGFPGLVFACKAALT